MILPLLLACVNSPGTHPVSPGLPGTDTATDPNGDTDTAAEVEDPTTFLFADTPVELALSLSAEAIAGLAQTPDDAPPEVEATFEWESESITIGVKLKGGQGSFRTFDQKPSFTLDFGEFVEDQRFHGLRHLHLNNLVQDVSMLGEHAAYRLYEERGLAAPRHGYARLTVNGEDYGLYGVVDKVDVDLLQHHFGRDDGLLFEGEIDDLEDYLVEDFDVVEDDGDPDPYAALHEVVGLLDAAPWNARGIVLTARFDRDRLLDAMATEVVTGNDDGYVTYRNNFFLWRNPDDGRFTMIPWGPDQAFLDRIDVLQDWPARLWDDCRNDPTCDPSLKARMESAVRVFEDPDWRARMEAVAAETEQDCLDDPRSESAGQACIEARAAFFAFLDERPAEVRAAIEAR